VPAAPDAVRAEVERGVGLALIALGGLPICLGVGLAVFETPRAWRRALRAHARNTTRLASGLSSGLRLLHAASTGASALGGSFGRQLSLRQPSCPRRSTAEPADDGRKSDRLVLLKGGAERRLPKRLRPSGADDEVVERPSATLSESEAAAADARGRGASLQAGELCSPSEAMRHRSTSSVRLEMPFKLGSRRASAQHRTVPILQQGSPNGRILSEKL
jgi:hypothetical protein